MAENFDFKGNKFCLNHIKEKVKFMCEDCKQKACNTCVSSTHKGHNLIGIGLNSILFFQNIYTTYIKR